MTSTEVGRFHRLSLITLVAVYVLIGVGGLVRATGSGMGCPDWPACFGNVVPPTRMEQLPANYKEMYAGLREKKNAKFARLLESLGFDEQARKIRTDKSILEEADFNAAKTWTEYINRLVGVIIGLLIMATTAYSIRFRRSAPGWFWLSVLCLGTVIFQGWLGSVVVSTNLTPWTVTIHMMPALLIVGILVYLAVATSSARLDRAPGLRIVVAINAAVLLIQILLGTQVREGIDQVAATLGEARRGAWLDSVGYDFIVHRSFSWVPALLGVWVYWKAFRSKPVTLGLAMLTLMVLTLATGAGMAYAGIPPFLQPLHLLLACGYFGILMVLYFQLGKYSVSRA